MKKVLQVACIGLMSLSLNAKADEVLTTVSTDTWGILSGGKVAYLDYHYATTTLFWAQVNLIDPTTKVKTLIAPASSTVYPYYISYGYAGNHCAFITYDASSGGGGGALGKSAAGGSGGGSRSSYLQYRDLSSMVTRNLISDISWKEMVWVAGNSVVWVDYRHLDTLTADSLNSEIYHYDLLTNQEHRITNNSGYQEKPFTDGQRIVWIDYSLNYGRLFMYTISTGVTEEIAAYAAGKNNPRVSGRYVAWEDYRNFGADPKNSDIYLYDITTNSSRAACNAVNFQGNSYIDGSRIAWEDYRNATVADPNNADIYSYNCETGLEESLITGAGFQGHPTMENDTLLWVTVVSNQMNLMMKKLAPSSEIRTRLTRQANSYGSCAYVKNTGIVIKLNSDNHQDPIMVRITNSKGALIKSVTSKSFAREISVSTNGMQSGIYLITISLAQNISYTDRVIIR